MTFVRINIISGKQTSPSLLHLLAKFEQNIGKTLAH